MPPEGPDFLTTWRVICARAWIDEDFKRDLQNDPDGVMKSFGFSPPQGMRFNIVENKDNILNLVLPQPPEQIQPASPADERTVSQYHSSCV
jgi:hypothetical protein